MSTSVAKSTELVALSSNNTLLCRTKALRWNTLSEWTSIIQITHTAYIDNPHNMPDMHVAAASLENSTRPSQRLVEDIEEWVRMRDGYISKL